MNPNGGDWNVKAPYPLSWGTVLDRSVQCQSPGSLSPRIKETQGWTRYNASWQAFGVKGNPVSVKDGRSYLLQMMEGAVLVAHNAPFDLGFLAAELEIARLPLPDFYLIPRLVAHEAEQVSLRELGQLAYAFPFDLLPFVGDLRRSDRFELTRQGLDLEMVAPVET